MKKLTESTISQWANRHNIISSPVDLRAMIEDAMTLGDADELTMRQDELHVVYIVHGGNPKECRRCLVSTRPPCPECGHSLSGNVDSMTKITVCEFCGKSVKMNSNLVSID